MIFFCICKFVIFSGNTRWSNLRFVFLLHRFLSIFRDFLKNVGPLQLTDDIKKRSAVQLVEDILSAGKYPSINFRPNINFANSVDWRRISTFCCDSISESASARTSFSQKSEVELLVVSDNKKSLSPKAFETEEKELKDERIKDMLELLCDESVCTVYQNGFNVFFLNQWSIILDIFLERFSPFANKLVSYNW